MKKTIWIIIILIALWVWIGYIAIKTDPTNIENRDETAIQNTEEAKTIDETKPLENKTISIEDIVQKMIKNSEVRENIKNLCQENEIQCPDNVSYTSKIDWDNYLIAFASNKEDWKDNSFNETAETYKVNIETLEVFRKSPFAGNFEEITTLSK